MAFKQIASRCAPVLANTRKFVSVTKPKKDVHAFAVIASTLGIVQVVNNVQQKGYRPYLLWFKKFVDDEPVVAFSCMIGLLGFLLPVVVVPIRRNLGFDTSQYDGPQPH